MIRHNDKDLIIDTGVMSWKRFPAFPDEFPGAVWLHCSVINGTKYTLFFVSADSHEISARRRIIPTF
jgi:hypothetical protein